MMVQLSEENLRLLVELSNRLGIKVDVGNEDDVNHVLNQFLTWLLSNYKIVMWVQALDSRTNELKDKIDRVKGELSGMYNDLLIKIEQAKASLRDLTTSAYASLEVLHKDVDRIISEINATVSPQITIQCRHLGPDILSAYAFLTSSKYITKAVGTNHYRELLNAVSFAKTVCTAQIGHQQ
jgi:hypothetical protein